MLTLLHLCLALYRGTTIKLLDKGGTAIQKQLAELMKGGLSQDPFGPPKNPFGPPKHTGNPFGDAFGYPTAEPFQSLMASPPGNQSNANPFTPSKAFAAPFEPAQMPSAFQMSSLMDVFNKDPLQPTTLFPTPSQGPLASSTAGNVESLLTASWMQPPSESPFMPLGKNPAKVKLEPIKSQNSQEKSESPHSLLSGAQSSTPDNDKVASIATLAGPAAKTATQTAAKPLVNNWTGEETKEEKKAGADAAESSGYTTEEVVTIGSGEESDEGESVFQKHLKAISAITGTD